MAGLIEIAEKVRPRCPHCHASLDLSEFLGEVFDRIIKTIATGDRVYVIGFGTFVARYAKGRIIKSFNGVETKTEGHWRIKFKPSKRVKSVINRTSTAK